MYDLTKEQIKTRLSISVVIGIVALIAAMAFNIGTGDLMFYHIVLGPLLMILGALPIVFDPKGYINECMLSFFKAMLFFVTLRFAKGFAALFTPFIWFFKSIVKSIKTVIWFFS